MFGADALRFTLARGASPGGDLSIGEDHARASRNFATKLFNATRFALMNGAAPAPLPDAGRAHRRRPLDPRPRGRGSRRGGFGVRQLRVQPRLRGALPLRVGRVLRLVRRAGEGATGRRDHAHHGGAGRRPRHAAETAAPGDAVRHRGAVEGAHRRRVARHRRLAEAVRLRSGSRCGTTYHRYAEAGHRGAPVPQRPGPRRPAEGARAAVRYRRRRSGHARSPR